MKNGAKRDRKNNNDSKKESATRIRFEFTTPTAESVSIAGSFNDWQPNITPMIAIGQCRWAKDLVLPPGDYEYRLVVDGQWTLDPLATETAPNPFGWMNSVRRVGNGD